MPSTDLTRGESVHVLVFSWYIIKADCETKRGPKEDMRMLLRSTSSACK